MSRFDIAPYSPDLKNKWESFIKSSKNATFLLSRDYMDYHADRFRDNSLIIYRNGKIYALLPACRIGDDIYSHAGLTYGGLIMGKHCDTSGVLETFSMILGHLAEKRCKRLIYRPIPHIYHMLPAEEDLYALLRMNATLSARNISSTIDRENRIRFRDIRKHGIRKATKAGIIIKECHDYTGFWKILSDNLQSRYGALPVHTIDEIELLSRRFPENIKLFGAFRNDRMIAGSVIYLTPRVLHCQYISASPEGKETGALDLLFGSLIDNLHRDVRYFDFGHSNLEDGKILNGNLIYQKEGFGGRGICYDTYTLTL